MTDRGQQPLEPQPPNQPSDVDDVDPELTPFETDGHARSGVTMLVNLLFTAGAGFVYWLIVAQDYSSADIGRAGALATSAMLVVFATNMGLTVAVGRHATTRDADDSARFTLAVGLTAVSSLIGSLVLFAIGPEEVMRAIAGPSGLQGEVLFAAIVVLLPLTQLADIRLLALRHRRLVVARSAASAVLKLGAAVILTLGGEGSGTLSLFAGLLGPDAVLGLLAGGALALPGLKRLWTTRALPPLRAAYEAARINYVSVLLAQGANVAVPFVVISHVTDTENANFYLAWSFTQIALLVPQSISWGLHVEGHGDESLFRAQLQKALRHALVLSGAATIASLPLIRLMPDLYGEDYATAGRIAPIMMAASLPFAVTIILLVEARVLRRFRAELRISGVYAALTVGSVWVLVATIGLNGAVAGVVIGITTAAVINMVVRIREERAATHPSIATTET